MNMLKLNTDSHRHKNLVARAIGIKSFLPSFLIFLLSSVAAYSQSWHNLGSGVNNAFNNAVVYSISSDTANRFIYAGGSFDTAGGIRAMYIATWNGVQWDSVGGGMNAPVQVTLLNHDTLYAGGDFTMAAGITANMLSDSLIYAEHIALWNGKEWDTLGSGMNGSVYALAVFNNKLYAGGDFTTAGRVHALHVAVWNGTNWDSVGYGFNFDVYSLTAWNGSLYAGGDFDSSGMTKMNFISRWNGSIWLPLGSGMNNYVNALMPFKGALYAAGNFDTAGGIPADYMAAWNGVAWDTVGEGVNAEASALDTNNGLLYVGGYYTTAENITVNGIASWNGTRWDSLSAGVGAGSVEAIASFKEGIFVGGNFSTAGYESASSIAFWDTSGLLNVAEIAAKIDEWKVYPNPNKGLFVIETALPSVIAGENYIVEIYNIMGSKIASLPLNNSSTPVDLSSQPSGVYFYRVLNYSLKGEEGAKGLAGEGKIVIEK